MGVRLLQGHSLKEAAQRLNMTRPALIKTLRERGVLKAKTNNLFDHPAPHYRFIRDGIFVVQLRAYNNVQNGIKRQYNATIVTPKGMAWLDEFLNDSDQSVA